MSLVSVLQTAFTRVATEINTIRSEIAALGLGDLASQSINLELPTTPHTNEAAYHKVVEDVGAGGTSSQSRDEMVVYSDWGTPGDQFNLGEAQIDRIGNVETGEMTLRLHTQATKVDWWDSNIKVGEIQIDSGSVDDSSDSRIKLYADLVAIEGGGDVNLGDDTGYLQIGPSGASNIGIDNNEIQSRNGAGGADFLGLNIEGGRVQLGGAGFGGQVDIQNGTIDADGDIYGRWTQKSNTTGITAGTGWSVDNYYSWRCGGWLQFRITVTRTGAAITVPASGNIGNVTLATLPASERGAVSIGLPLIGGSPSGRMAACHYQPSNGVIQMGSVGGSSNIATGESFDIGGFMYVA